VADSFVVLARRARRSGVGARAIHLRPIATTTRANRASTRPRLATAGTCHGSRCPRRWPRLSRPAMG